MRRLSLMALALLLIAPGVRADDKPAGEAGKLQGSWKGLVGPNKDVPITVTIKGTDATFLVEANGQEIELKGEIKVDDKAKPATIDWTKFTSPNGDPIPENLGIFKVEDDKLTMCNGGPGNDRPTEFKGGEGGPPNLTVLTRVKDEKPKDEKPKDEKADKDAPKGDLGKLQGNWKTKLGELEITLEIKGQKVLARHLDGEGKEVKLEGEVVINEEPKLKTIDFVKFKGGNGEDMGDNLGLYVFDGDKVTIVLGGPGNSRPTEFKAGEGNGSVMLTLEKVN